MVAKKIKKKQTKTVAQYKKENLKFSIAIKELEKKNVRLLAEFDNYKKRSMSERQNIFKYEGLEFINSILPAIDDFERILNSDETKKNKAMHQGLDLLLQKLVSILNENGISSYKAVNEVFNPDLHEALMTQDSKKKKNIILEEFQKGYKYHDKVIRHAKVIVSK